MKIHLNLALTDILHSEILIKIQYSLCRYKIDFVEVIHQ